MRTIEHAVNLVDWIEVNPKIMMGKAVIRGTRIGVALILRKQSEGATEDGLLAAYPTLFTEGIRAAVAYAADSLAHEKSIFLESATK